MRSETGFDRVTSVDRSCPSTDLYLPYLLVTSIAVIKIQVGGLLRKHAAELRRPLAFARHACQIPAYHGLPSRRPGSDIPRYS
jgi:hypothetical protein